MDDYQIPHNYHLTPSPEWHIEELRKTEESFNAGKQESIDWLHAKEMLRKHPGPMNRKLKGK